MSVYTTEKISDHDFKIYHAIYSQENIFMSYDWKERVDFCWRKMASLLAEPFTGIIM